MAPCDWERYPGLFEGSRDQIVLKIGDLVARMYGDPARRPPADIIEREAEIAAAVRAQFPTQFADEFEGWLEASAEFWRAIQAGNLRSMSTSFRIAWDRLYDLWVRLVTFLPFLLMTSVNRLPPDIIRAHAGRDLREAIKNYDDFYTREDDLQRERDQRLLIANLLKFYRRLDAAGALGEAFVFHPILAGSGGLAGLFPPRFESHLEFIQQVRNHVQHAELSKRPREILKPLYRLVQACLLDVVAILRPICGRYYLVFFTAERRTEDGRIATGLAFSGREPARAEFVLPAAGAADADRIRPGQLYLVRRGKERIQGAQAEPLASVDALDLTPFLIFEAEQMNPARVTAAGTAVGTRPEARAAETPGADDRQIFVFRRYGERNRQLAYREFTGSEELLIGEDFAQLFLDLRDAIRRFTAELRRLREGAPDADLAAPQLVSRVTWSVSAEHLKAVMNPDRYDETGTPVASAGGGDARNAFTEDLFVAPGEAARIEQFFGSGKRGLVIAGRSGIGKSNLLCHLVLRERRAGRPCLFVAARNLRDPDLLAFLQEVASRIDRAWRLPALAAYFQERRQPLTVFVDAVNEYAGPGGPRELLRRLIAVAQDEHLFKPLRLVVTCRSEVWDDYRGEDAAPLDPAVFFTSDALRLEGFHDERRRAELFAAYQRFFRLRPETYDRLSPPVRALIRHPFMMAMVAETYGNEVAGGAAAAAPPKTIPRDLDYFEVFRRLTERKLSDARWGPRRSESTAASLRDCLYQFARVLFRKLTAESLPSAAGPPEGPGSSGAGRARDALRRSELEEDAAFRPFAVVEHPRTQLSALDAAVQVGLLEKVITEELDDWGNPRQGRVYRFFHDQYTQYQLAAVYNREVLGAIKGRALSEADLDAIVGKAADLIHRSAAAPVLAGALDHWLYANMRLPDVDLLLPLLSALCGSDSGAVRYYARTFLAGLVARNIVAPDVLYPLAFRQDSRALCLVLAEAFDVMEADAGPPPAVFRQFIDACTEARSDEVIGRLADIFAHRFAAAPSETADFLDRALDSLAGLPAAALVGRIKSLTSRQLPLVCRFGLLAVTAAAFDRPADLGVLWEVARRKYSLLLGAVLTSRRPGVRGSLARRVLYPALEQLGIDQWRRHIGGMSLGGNDRLFVDNDGVVQRDVVHEFFPYAVALHNGEWDALSLAWDSPFRRLVTRMMSFRVTSVIGYFAVVALPLLLARTRAGTESIIDDLIALDTPSGRFFGPLLLVNLTYTDRALSEPCLRLLDTKILPWFLDNRHEVEWPVLAAFGIVANDVAALWPFCESILDKVFRNLARGGDPSAIARAGAGLVKASFFPDPTLGERVLSMMLDRGYLTAAAWRPCVLQAMAGLLARSPVMLERLLRDRGLGEQVEREARRFVTEDLIVARDVHLGQVHWNRFLAHVMASNAKLRCLIIKILVGGLAQSNSVEDYAREFRRFVVEVVAAYLGEDADEERYRTLAVEAALAEAESRRVVGGGRLWQGRPAG
jgi:hypothetical protein